MSRDNYHCVCCGKAGKDRQGGDDHLEYHSDSNPANLDAHHITDRHEFKNGGYVKENGITVCDACHVLAEEFHSTGIAHPGFSPEDLYEIIASSFEIAKKADDS